MELVTDDGVRDKTRPNSDYILSGEKRYCGRDSSRRLLIDTANRCTSTNESLPVPMLIFPDTSSVLPAIPQIVSAFAIDPSACEEIGHLRSQSDRR